MTYIKQVGLGKIVILKWKERDEEYTWETLF
jgi:hypothetical protein